MSSKPGPKGIDHDAERERYRTGDETFEDIAARLGVNVKTVENMAARKHPKNAGETWGEMRAAWRAGTAAEGTRRAGDRAADAFADVRAKGLDAASLALDELLKRLRAGGVKRQVAFSDHIAEFLDPIADKDLIATARLIIATKVEMGGADGGPLKVSQTLDELDIEELRKLAGGT